MKHTSATMFVDDFVTGRVPDVCAMSGEPTTDRQVISAEIDGPSPGWLFLLLFPPVGWLILALVFIFSRRSQLAGTIPVTNAVYEERRSRRRRGYAAIAVGAIILLASLRFTAVAQLGGMTMLLGLAVVVGATIMIVRARSGWARLTLDASRRWVTIQPVHPAFAAAVDAQQSSGRVGA